MINIKDLHVKTKEGFSVKNLKHFPSMEWGENGGLECDVYMNDKLIGTLYNDGNGGSAIMSHANGIDFTDINAKLYACLKRIDDDYAGVGMYANLYAEKNATNIDSDDYENLVNVLENRYYDLNCAKKMWAKGYSVATILKNWDKTITIGSYAILTKEQVKVYAERAKMKDYKVLSFDENGCNDIL